MSYAVIVAVEAAVVEIGIFAWQRRHFRMCRCSYGLRIGGGRRHCCLTSVSQLAVRYRNTRAVSNADVVYLCNAGASVYYMSGDMHNQHCSAPLWTWRWCRLGEVW